MLLSHLKFITPPEINTEHTAPAKRRMLFNEFTNLFLCTYILFCASFKFEFDDERCVWIDLKKWKNEKEIRSSGFKSRTNVIVLNIREKIAFICWVRKGEKKNNNCVDYSHVLNGNYSIKGWKRKEFNFIHFGKILWNTMSRMNARLRCVVKGDRLSARACYFCHSTHNS